MSSFLDEIEDKVLNKITTITLANSVPEAYGDPTKVIESSCKEITRFIRSLRVDYEIKEEERTEN